MPSAYTLAAFDPQVVIVPIPEGDRVNPAVQNIKYSCASFADLQRLAGELAAGIVIYKFLPDSDDLRRVLEMYETDAGAVVGGLHRCLAKLQDGENRAREMQAILDRANAALSEAAAFAAMHGVRPATPPAWVNKWAARGGIIPAAKFTVSGVHPSYQTNVQSNIGGASMGWVVPFDNFRTQWAQVRATVFLFLPLVLLLVYFPKHSFCCTPTKFFNNVASMCCAIFGAAYM